MADYYRYRMDLLADGTVLLAREALAQHVRVDDAEVVESYDLDKAEHDRLKDLPPLEFDTKTKELVDRSDKKKKPIQFKGEKRPESPELPAPELKLQEEQNAVKDPEDARAIDSL